jgi:hypothetical protein
MLFRSIPRPAKLSSESQQDQAKKKLHIKSQI